MSRSVRPDNPPADPAVSPEKQKVIDGIMECLGELQIDTKKVALTTSLEREIGLDSLDAMELTFELEEKFDVSLDQGEVFDADTVTAIADYVLKKRGK